jgi:hypothetical protein
MMRAEPLQHLSNLSGEFRSVSQSIIRMHRAKQRAMGRKIDTLNDNDNIAVNGALLKASNNYVIVFNARCHGHAPLPW